MTKTTDLTAVEAAAALHVSRRTILRWINSGRLPAWRGGRDWRIPTAEVERIKCGAER
jgi:excisionase family DNA binding protein